MSGSSIGKLFSVTTWGESHGKAVGVTIDGCPSGLHLAESQIQQFLNRRKPGQSEFTTSRKEADKVEILSGIFEGRTTGTPITLMVRNEDYQSRDYQEIAEVFRPGHADYTYHAKYGFRDYRGGGRSSGRETVSRVAAGAVASLLLIEFGITLIAFTKAIGPVIIPFADYHFEEITSNPLYMPNKLYAEKAQAHLHTAMSKGDSCGGIIECIVKGVPPGIGEPVFDKLDARLAAAVMSIGSIKSVEIGDGIRAANSLGSQHNDAFYTESNRILKSTNHSGGVLGGISDGSDIFVRVGVKPTPSIAVPQASVTRTGKPHTISVHGRHDPCIVPRAVVVVEAMVAITIMDLLLQNMGSRLEYLKKIYPTSDNSSKKPS